MEASLDVGRYRIYGAIASGGMAAVHLGRLIGEVGFSRPVAVKRVHPKRLGMPEMITALVDEARLASRIQHPNVVPTLDVFVADGELFVVMDYVVGETLANLVKGYIAREEPVPVPIALSVGVGMLHGLHAAHEATSELGEPLAIVHRDVSPQNLLVGADGLTRVLDFGIAKATVRLSSTMSGQIKGKLRYMAPEQMRGEATRRTDIFATGIVLWEMLSGRRLYKTDAEVAEALAYDRAPPSLDTVRDTIPSGVAEVIARALRRAPDDRYADAMSFAVALEEAGEVAPARRVGDWVRTVAADALRDRAERLAAIDRETARRSRTAGTPDGTTSTGLVSPAAAADTTVDAPAQAPPAGGERTESALTTQVVSDPTPASPDAPSRSRRRDHRVWWALFALLGGGGAILVGLSESSPPTGPDTAPATTADDERARATPPLTATPPPQTAEREGHVPAVGSIATPSSSAIGASSSAPGVKLPLGGVAPWLKPPPDAGTQPAVPAVDPCNPPYTVDANGIQRFKEACL